MKGAIGLLTIAVVLWVFWMSWEWLRNPDRKWNGDNTDNDVKF